MKANEKHRILIGVYYCLTIVSMIIGSSCQKAVEVGTPTTELTDANTYSNSISAAAVLSGIYSNMSSYGLSTGITSISLECGLQSDELVNYSPDQLILEQFYTNTLNSANTYFWNELYNEIYVTNAAIAGVSSSSALTATTKQQLLGEAKFMRAFLNFYAVNLYGDVPIVTTTNYVQNNSLTRSPVSDVYQQIVSDLTDAKNLLSDSYLTSTGSVATERVRPNKGAAEALLARTYLYTGDWADAAAMADSVILNVNNYQLDSNLNNVFLTNSTEAIFQFSQGNTSFNTQDGFVFILTSAPNELQPVALSTNLLSAFEPNDKRFANWIDSFNTGSQTFYFPYKYKVNSNTIGAPVTEYLTILRLAEQYLIRAEAEAEGAGAGLYSAIADLNVIRNRAGLPNTNASTQDSVLMAIQHERQVELFTEWGHRWFDMKRTGTANTIMSAITGQKGGVWSPNWQLVPIPVSEILINSKLTQNQGY